MSRPQRNATRKSKQQARGWKGPKRTPKSPVPRPEPMEIVIRFDDKTLGEEYVKWVQGNAPKKFRLNAS